MRTVEIKCWVTRDRKGYSLFLWSGDQPAWQGVSGWCGTDSGAAMGELDENAIPNVPNRRGCWPARLVVEVEEGK